VVHTAVRGGPLSRNAGRVDELMRDPERTQVLPISLAEELPTQETAQLVERVRAQLGLRFDRVVVNAVAEPPPFDRPDELRHVLSHLPTDLPLRALPGPRSLAHAVAHLTSRHALNRRYLVEIETRTALPTTRLPLIASGIDGPSALRRLAAPLLGEAEGTHPPSIDPQATDR
jgi:anion-transporting  ArsA/GET3 family ATPase